MILADLNVLLDVLQQREPHYASSAAVLDRIVRGGAAAALPAHAFTTIHFIVSRYRSADEADGVIDWLLRYFHVAGVAGNEIQRARALGWKDFEDRVVAAAAESCGCDRIVTRNVKDFQHSPVQAITPREHLLEAVSDTPRGEREK